MAAPRSSVSINPVGGGAVADTGACDKTTDDRWIKAGDDDCFLLLVVVAVVVCCCCDFRYGTLWLIKESANCRCWTSNIFRDVEKA